MGRADNRIILYPSQDPQLGLDKESHSWICKKCPGRARFNYILDVVLLAGVTLMILSGIAIARTIDFSWLKLGGSPMFWRVMYASSSLITLVLFGIHLGLHWNWVLQRFNFKRATNGKEI